MGQGGDDEGIVPKRASHRACSCGSVDGPNTTARRRNFEPAGSLTGRVWKPDNAARMPRPAQTRIEPRCPAGHQLPRSAQAVHLDVRATRKKVERSLAAPARRLWRPIATVIISTLADQRSDCPPAEFSSPTRAGCAPTASPPGSHELWTATLAQGSVQSIARPPIGSLTDQNTVRPTADALKRRRLSAAPAQWLSDRCCERAAGRGPIASATKSPRSGRW